MKLFYKSIKIVGVRAGIVVMGLFALVASVTTHVKAQSQAPASTDIRQKYPKMAPIDEYLMSNRDAEIALARSAAPEAISKDASVLVLTRTGWETAVKGTNGFVCMVERAWASSIDFPEMWNPKIRGVDCINPAAARTLLPIVYRLTQMALAGDSTEERIVGIQAAFAKKEIPPLEPGAMGYMMSKEAYLTDDGSHNLSHLMIFVQGRKGIDWGAGVPHSPVVGSVSYWGNAGNTVLPPLRFFVVSVPRWSDGTSIFAK